MPHYIDLTHTITADMPVYPGTEKPILKSANTLEKDGFCETLLTMYSHTGTHTDAPAHVIEGGMYLEDFSADFLCGRALLLDFSHKEEDSVISLDELLVFEERLSECDFLIIKTGYEKKWGTDDYFHGFTVLSSEASDFIFDSKIRGILVDAISIDPVGKPLSNHCKLLSKGDGFIITENLRNLDAIPTDEFEVIIMPLKFISSDGAPTRVVARCDR